MEHKYFDISEITLDGEGRVELNDQTLKDLEGSLSVISSGGGIDNNWYCSGNNPTCTNSFCGGTSNSDCMNSLTCGSTNNGKNCLLQPEPTNP